jgi:hypothetical protein
MGLCNTKDLPPRYTETDTSPDINNVIEMTMKARKELILKHTEISNQAQNDMINKIDKLIIEAAGNGCNKLECEYIEPKESSKHDLFIELRDKSIKNIVKHFKGRKFKVDYYIYSTTTRPIKIYIRW